MDFSQSLLRIINLSGFYGCSGMLVLTSETARFGVFKIAGFFVKFKRFFKCFLVNYQVQMGFLASKKSYCDLLKSIKTP